MIEDFKVEINKYLKDIGQCNQTQAFKNEMKNIKTYRKIQTGEGINKIIHHDQLGFILEMQELLDKHVSKSQK